MRCRLLSALALCLLSLHAISQVSEPNPQNSTSSPPASPLTKADVDASIKAALHVQANNPDPKNSPSLPSAPSVTKADVDASIKAALDAQDKHTEFELSLGIGSLVDGPGTSDYTNQSNILQATNLGRATPQYLVGVSLRTPFPNFGGFGHSRTDCVSTQATPGSSSAKRAPYLIGEKQCDYWRQNPWKAFVSLKFASGSSQTLNGFVLGGSYQFGHYVDALVGFGFTPFNEPSPGLRVTASQFVTAQQKLGNDLNFDPSAMLAGSKNAFDGFSLTDSSGKLIYAGNPLEVHFRGGIVLGVAIPINFASVFTGKAQ